MTAYEYSVKEPILEVRNVSVHYDKPILRDLNFTIRDIVRPGMTQGQIVSILAPSGMGKSQAFRCIYGLKKPDVGDVYLDEAKRTVCAGMVGVVAQDYPLFAHMTVFDNVMMAAKRKMAEDQAKELTITLLERFGMGDKHNVYPHQISGGQRQRVAIIQQMVCSGHLLLMDEPFSGLDVNLKAEVQNLITTLAAADELNTIVLTTHDIGAAIAISDTILLLGRERDATGAPIPGANIRETIDLAKEGLAWHPEIETMPEFHKLESDIRARFRDL
jgi:NitT/TauT family transport system ATP-binding protein